MKRLLSVGMLGAAAALVVCSAPAAAQAGIKIGFVNSPTATAVTWMAIRAGSNPRYMLLARAVATEVPATK